MRSDCDKCRRRFECTALTKEKTQRSPNPCMLFEVGKPLGIR